MVKKKTQNTFEDAINAGFISVLVLFCLTIVVHPAQAQNMTEQPALNEMVDGPVNDESFMDDDGMVEKELKKPAEKVQLTGDQLNYLRAENKVIATGNVEVIKGEVTLLCDELEFDRTTEMAHAKGNVVLIQNGQRFEGEQMNFDFGRMKGDFLQARIYSKPFYGTAEKIIRVDDNHMQLINAYLTTSDWDKPEFRFGAKKVDIYPGDKAVARNVRLLAGNVPILYIPRFTQDLRNKEPVFTWTPGYDSDWGAFLLTGWHHKLNENVKLTLHLDYRQRKDLATGLDVDYNTVKYGDGIIRTYYMNERTVSAKHFFEERLLPTIERERFKVEWRHQWEIDKRTNAIMQYYKLSDSQFLEDYFEREFDEDENPDTFFLLTKSFSRSTLSFRTDARVNRFESKVERLPEISYDFSNTEILDTGLYFTSNSTYSNLVSKSGSPSEDRDQTQRFHLDSELSYPMKLGIIEFRPRAGGENTYYSRAKSREDYDTIRGQFKTGADISTKFFRIFDVHTNKFGMDIERLRHIITPSVDYNYRHDPTFASDKLDQFDGIDSRFRSHSINFSIENKLQTKRNNSSVDLTRLIVSVPFNLKEDPGKGGFNSITADWDLHPNDWLSFYMDANYSTQEEKLKTLNFDLYINDTTDRWYASIGKRFDDDVDDQITTEFGYRINQKWSFHAYNRYNLDSGTLKEQEYGLSRDLHSWVMDINFNETRGDGDEIWLVFTLKDFPELGFDFGSSFNRRKAGHGQ